MKIKKKVFLALLLLGTGFLHAQQANEEENAIEIASTQTQDKAEVAIDLSTETRKELGAMLNKLLADEYILYVKLQNFHWNVYGPFFNDLHAFFQKLYEQQQIIIDTIAERIRSLAIKADGSMTIFLQKARIFEQTNEVPSDKQMLRILLNDYQKLIKQVRSDIVKTAELNDWADNNFLSDLIQKHEKTSWKLRALLTKQPDK